MQNIHHEWAGLSPRPSGEGHLIAAGWLHRQAFLFVPKLQGVGGHGEKQGVWGGQIRSRHVPWCDSELPVGMTLFFFFLILLNRIIFFTFWPGLCLLLVLLQSLMLNTICLPRFAFRKKTIHLFQTMSETLCLFKSTEVTGLNRIILLCVNWVLGLSSLCAWSAEHNAANLQIIVK